MSNDPKVQVVDIVLSDVSIVSVQMRVNGISQDHVDDLAESLLNGMALPRPKAVRVDDVLHVFDGNHTLAAHKKIGKTTVQFEIHGGGVNDALLGAVCANRTHGLKVTAADKRNGITALLKDPYWQTFSNSALAEKIGSTHQTVGKIRKELQDSGVIPVVKPSRNKNGKLIANAERVTLASPVQADVVAEIPANGGDSVLPTTAQGVSKTDNAYELEVADEGNVSQSHFASRKCLSNAGVIPVTDSKKSQPRTQETGLTRHARKLLKKFKQLQHVDRAALLDLLHEAVRVSA